MRILVLNSGSSSIKYSLFAIPGEKLLKKGLVERIGQKKSRIKNHKQALEKILKDRQDIDAIGHRVVHGAENFRKPQIITKKVLVRLERLSSLAPLHNPANITGIKVCAKILPSVAQVAVFDTAFHQAMPAYAYMYGLPFSYYRRFGIRRYGFHGTSHEYVAVKAAGVLGKPLSKLKLITCHLGNGSSIAAVKAGRSIDTSMGFTPLEGLLMGTRSGDIDPALIFFLKKKLGVSLGRIEHILNKESGLKGLSGISNDLRQIKKAASKGNSRAKLALDIFIYRLKKYISAYFGILGGADAIVFTGGIGENNPDIIKKVRVALNVFFKKAGTKILVIPTDEELIIARKTYELVSKKI
ncbi:MAG: acetate kinase [Candidatus Omnitrophica bacterium]|nr:acetate kinase [Candidatus Omnitrophota bacterium]